MIGVVIGSLFIAALLTAFLKQDFVSRVLTYSLAMAVSFFVFFMPTGDTWIIFAEPWVQAFGIELNLELDSLARPFIFLLALSLAGAVSVSRSARETFWSLCAAVGGVVAITSQDLMVFFIGWELLLLPLFILLAGFGTQEKAAAAIRYAIFSFTTSICMLIGIILLVWLYAEQTNEVTFSIAKLSNLTAVTPYMSHTLFILFFISLAMKIPLVPIHSWLVPTYRSAPQSLFVLLAGLKLGVLGLFRFVFPILPTSVGYFAPGLAVLGVITILQGAFLACHAKEPRELIAQSSLSHAGFVMLALASLTPAGVDAALMQSFFQGIATVGLSLFVVRLEEKRKGVLTGLAHSEPFFCILFFIVLASSLAVPLTAGFVGEFSVLVASYQRYPILTAVAALSAVLTAIYLLRWYMATCFGEESEVHPHEGAPRYNSVIIICVVLSVLYGLVPTLAQRMWSGASLTSMAHIVGAE